MLVWIINSGQRTVGSDRFGLRLLGDAVEGVVVVVDGGAGKAEAVFALGPLAEEIGELVLFMCSDACTYMTADTVYVNGGGGWR